MPDIIDDSNKRDNEYTPQQPPPTPDPNTPVVPPENSEPFSRPIVSPNPIIPDTQFIPDKPPKKSKKKLVIGLITAVIATLVIGSTVAFAYYTNPDKVLLDAFSNGIKSKTAMTEGNMLIKDSKNDGTVAISFTSQSDTPKVAGSLDVKIKIAYKDFKVDLQGAGMVAESGDFYLKVNDVAKLLDEYLKTDSGKLYASEPSMAPMIAKLKAFVAKIDGQWIKIDKDDISQYSKDYDKQQACTKKAIKKFYENSSWQQQTIDTYQKNRFLVIKDTGKSATINNQDSVAYGIKFNVKNFNTFGKELDKTDFIKALNKCVDSENPTNSTSDKEIADIQKQLDKIKTTIWISRWSHELNQIQIGRSDSDGSLDFKSNIDTKTAPNLKDPNKFLKAKDLIAELQAIYMEALGDPTATGL